MENKTRYLRDFEVAERYGISRSSVWRWRKKGKIPEPIKFGEDSTRWSLSELEAWEQILASRRGVK